MADNEINIGGKRLSENTTITTNIKTLLFVAISLFSILMTSFTVFYFDMRSRDKATNLKLQETTKTIQKDVSNALKEELLIYEERQLQIIKDIGDIRGDIKVILDRTNNNKQAVYSIKNAPKPTSEIPPQEILNDIQNPE